MTKTNKNQIGLKILGNLGWPLIWGMAAWVAFYTLVHLEIIQSAFVRRYFAGHPVEFIEAALFFVGLAALALKGIEIGLQSWSLPRISLGDVPAGGQRVASCPDLLEGLNGLTWPLQNNYLTQRLRDAVEFVRRKGSSDGLDDHLKYLADMDVGRSHDGNGLVRIIIWATPMLGFLGTVIGITLAIGGLDPVQLVDAPKDAMGGLLGGLGIAFDTTALALSLSMVLMFVQFVNDQFESQLLTAVDARAEAELTGRFQELGGTFDPHVASIHKAAEKVAAVSENLVQNQTALWQTTIDAAHQQWSQLAGATAGQIQTALNGAIDSSLKTHAANVMHAEASAAQRSSELWQKFERTLSENAKIMQAQQREMATQSATMLKVVSATGDVVRLENALNENLNTLAGATHFKDTVMSLAAAIHLLNARFSNQASHSSSVDLSKEDRAA